MENLTQSFETVLACSVCLGDSESPQVMGANLAIGFMALVVVGMLSTLLFCIFQLNRRAKLAAKEADLELESGDFS